MLNPLDAKPAIRENNLIEVTEQIIRTDKSTKQAFDEMVEQAIDKASHTAKPN